MSASAMVAPVAAGPERPGETLAERLKSFLQGCRRPRLLEPGVAEIALGDGSFQMVDDRGAVQLEAWDKEHFVSRRVVGIKVASRERLELETVRFGGKRGQLFLYDAFRPGNEGLGKKGKRLVFGEAFRGMMRRAFAGWRIEEFSTEAHLEHSLSPAYPRALLRRGKMVWVAMAAAPAADADRMLSFALIWLDYVRRQHEDWCVEGLALFLPDGLHRATCLRLPYLNVRTQAFSYGANFMADPVDLADSGNIASLLEASEVGPRPRLEPEAVIESQLGREIQALDPHLQAGPVYGQVLSFHGVDRGIFDLLAVDDGGRLTVIEIKAEEAIHLPLQALDYWIRVKHHLERGDFARLFPGIGLAAELPRLMLAAPALCFHPSNEVILRFFRPDIPVERIGLAHGPGGPVRVLFRERNRTSTMRS